MQLSEWPSWFKNLEIEKKWFVVVVLIRPIMEGFYGLKKISILLSPLYWLGIAVPIAIILTVLTKYKKPARGVTGGFGFRLFGLFVLLSVTLLLLRTGGMLSIQTALRVTFILYLFAYVVRYLNDWQDIEGLLIAFLFSAFYPLLMMLYEILVSPINVQMSRGLERIRGFYADSFNYSIYMMLSTVVLLYFRDRWLWLNYKVMLPFIVVILLGLYHLNHIASWAVFMTIVISRITARPKMVYGVFLAAVLLTPIFLKHEFDDNMLTESKLIGKEYEILLGERPVEQAFHGRVTRWQFYYSMIEEAAPQVWLFGIYADFDAFPDAAYVLVAPHNDFLRIFLLAGLPGLVGYLIFLASVLKSASSDDRNKRFLKYSVVAILAIYSVSSVPTIYSSLMSVVMPVLLVGDDKHQS